MEGYADFSVDQTRFADLDEFADELHENKQKLVLIIDGGISAEKLDNPYYVAANKAGALIKSAINPNPAYNGSLVSTVWPK